MPCCQALQTADCFIIIHPNWWGVLPAILKNWIDKVMRLKVRYEIKDIHKGNPVTF
ncbi:NAD(P)H-dependent oxidoreductase [Dyadobacter sediminis]|uniref:NAD(P)H-dependent oxidoreductase n=1 Tax=Dyadobacter sediminis TaxID=1493691 RepID=UPI001BB2ADB3